MVMRVCRHYCIILTKSSRCNFSQHLPFQKKNSSIKVGCESCSRLIKKHYSDKSQLLLYTFKQINFMPCLGAFMTVFEKQVNVQCGIGSISMLIFSDILTAANCTIAKNS